MDPSPLPKRRIAALLCAAIALLGCGSEPRAFDGPRSVIFILIDTLRADHADPLLRAASLTPTLDALAERGTRFERVIAPSSWTKTSMASLLTSRDPHRHGVRRVRDRLPGSHTTLAGAFAAAGFHTIAINTNPWLTSGFGFDAGYARYETIEFANAAAVNARALALLDAAPQGPLFLSLHYMDVHAPYTPSAHYFTAPALELPGRGAVGNRGVERLYRKRGLTGPGVEQRVRALYAAGVRETDAALGGLIDELRKRGRLDDSLLVVTSDHGEAFREHGTTEHGWNLYPEVTNVPLIFWGPGFVPEAGRIDSQVRSIDIAPTLLALSGIEPPASFEGKPLLPMRPGAIDDRLALSAVGLHDNLPELDYVAIRSRKHLLVRERRSGRDEFYDLARDPGAQRNLGDEAPAAESLRERIPEAAAPLSQSVPLDEQTRRHLEAIGYLGSDE